MKKPLKISNALFWTIASCIIAGSFSLGVYIGQARFDKEKSDYYEQNKLLINENTVLKAQNDSLIAFCPPASFASGFFDSLEDGSMVDPEFFISGSIISMPADHHLWLVVHPKLTNGWWPQVSEIIIKPDGTWSGKVFLGGENNKGEIFEIHLVIADKESNASFSPDRYFINSLPDGARSLNYVTVIKN